MTAPTNTLEIMTAYGQDVLGIARFSAHFANRPATKEMRRRYVEGLAKCPSKRYGLVAEALRKNLITDDRARRLIAMLRLQRRIRSSKGRRAYQFWQARPAAWRVAKR